MILGVTGLYGAGKDTFAEYLIQKGFVHLSLSDFIREELKKQGKELTRENLIKEGNTLRRTKGSKILGEMALARMKQGKSYVITSIRNKFEVEALKSHKEFTLISVEAHPEIRFQRIKERNREQDPKTFEEFLKTEGKELQGNDPTAQDLLGVAAHASHIVKNEETVDELKTKIDTLLSKISDQNYQRPTWDEYFMNLAREVGKRGTCDRGRAGSIIVKNKRILTTGYAGAPTGLSHCDEVGHQMQEVYDEEGNKSMHCVRTTHAEQNAIIQAARIGIPLEGATLYCKMEPCHICTKMIINAGIQRVVAEKRYHAAQRSREMLKEAGIELEVLYDELEQYKNQ